MTWATNDNESTLGLLKGKHKSSQVKGGKYASGRGTVNTQVLQLESLQ